MAEIKTGVTFSLKDLFSQGMKKAAGAASDFSSKTIGAINKIDSAISGTAANLAALGLSLSLGAAAKGVIEMDHRMTRLGISANASAEQISELKKAVFDVAQASDVKIDSTHILGGLEVIINKTNDLKYAEENIRNIGLAVQATGESGDSIGALFSEFHNFKYSSEQISALMDDMVAQANEGAFSLADFAKAAPQIFSTLNAIGFGTAPENIKKTNAALQIINAGTKSPEKAIASFNAAMNELADPEKRKNLKRMGIDVIDPATKSFRDFNDIMSEIAKKSENARNADYLNRIFGASSMQAIRSYVTHGERMYENLTDLGDTTGLLQKQSAAMADTLQSNIKNLQTAFNAFAASNLSKPLSDLTGLLNKLSEDPERIKKVFTGIAVGIGAITAVKGIAGISRFVSSLSRLKGGEKINIAESLNMASAMPVYVTNWNGGAGFSGMGSGGQFQQPLLGQGNPLTNAQKAVSAITPRQYAGAAAGMAVAAAFVKIPQMMNELEEIKQNEELTSKERGKAKGGAIGDTTGSIVGAAAGGAAGIAAGAAVGAAVGSVVPLLGTAVGALVGAGIGAAGMWLGGKAGRAVGEGIGGALADDSAEINKQRRILAADLPPQITREGSSINPQKVDLGHADINLNVSLTDDRPKISIVTQNNTMPAMFNTGSRVALRRNGM